MPVQSTQDLSNFQTLVSVATERQPMTINQQKQLARHSTNPNNMSMNVNNINSMTIYNNIQYQQLQSQRPFDLYTTNLSKAISDKHNSANANV